MRRAAGRRIALAVLAQPRVWPTAARQAVALAPRRWWRSWPPAPWPDPDYLRFRLLTQYGDESHDPEPDDVVRYLRWCRATRRRSASPSSARGG